MTKEEFEAMKAKAYELNRAHKERAEKCADMDVLVGEIMKLPYGQIKKVMTDEVMAVLTKYGYAE